MHKFHYELDKMSCVSKNGKLYYLVFGKWSWDVLTSLVDKSSFGSEWQVPRAHGSREVNLLRGLQTVNRHNHIDPASFPPWRYDWGVRQTVRLLRACHKSYEGPGESPEAAQNSQQHSQQMLGKDKMKKEQSCIVWQNSCKFTPITQTLGDPLTFQWAPFIYD